MAEDIIPGSMPDEGKKETPKAKNKAPAAQSNAGLGPPIAEPAKEKKADPMEDLWEDLRDFVAKNNKAIEDLMKKGAGKVWDVVKETGPMKKLLGALDDAKEAIKNKASEIWYGTDNAPASKDLNDVKDYVNDKKDAISQAMQEVEQKMDAEVKQDASASPEHLVDSGKPEATAMNAPADSPNPDFAAQALHGVDEVKPSTPEPQSPTPAPNVTPDAEADTPTPGR